MLKLFFWLLLIGNGILFAVQRGYVGAATPERHEPQRLAQQLQPQTLVILPPDSEKLVPAAKAVPGGAAGAADTAADAAKDGDAAARSDKADPPPAMVVDNQPPPKPAAKAESKTESKADSKSDSKADSKADLKAAPKPNLKTIACTEIGNFNSAEVRRFEAQLEALHLPVRASVHNVQEAGSHMVYIPSQDGKDGADRRAAELRRLGIQDFYVMPESQSNPALRWAISLGVFKTEEAAKAYIGQLIPQGVRSARIMARNVNSNKQAYQWRNIDQASKAALDALAAKFPAQEQRACSS